MSRRRRSGPSSRRSTRIAFAVIVTFVLAQVLWWVVFQERYISQVTRERLSAWERDAAATTLALETAGGSPELRAALLAAYPHLQADGDRLIVAPEVERAFRRQQAGYIRMFAFEGPFFGLVILSGLVFIGISLRSERELKQRQQNFLSAVTHEFKTPISTLRLLVETALMRPLSPERQRDYLGRMEAELARLERTSEQVLASARLEHASDPPRLEARDLNEVVRAIVAHARGGLEARGARLELRLADEPLPVSIDEAAFAVVLANLLDNAVKYSRGAVKPVRVRTEAEGDLAALHVEDEGIGIAEGEAGRLFERFYRSGDEMTRESEGVGLGLHLVRSTTEAMNGWVRCGNREGGRGARFTVLLPRRVALTAAGGTPLEGP